MPRDSKPVDKSVLRALMPNAAKRVDLLRGIHGASVVNDWLRRSFNGEPGWFFYAENGLTLGTPDTRATHDCYWDENDKYMRRDPPWIADAMQFALTLGIEIEIKDMQDFDEASARAKQLREIYKSVRYA